MHCKNCDYPLWNLKARECPECGAPFRPSEFEFVVNSVQFCCPKCDQAYYGTSPTGHLLPPDFTCVACGHALHLDEMVLRPGIGIEEHRTRPAANPWLLRRERGFFGSWLATIGRALVGPYRLMQETPVQSSMGQAWFFAALTALATWFVAVVPMLCLMIIPFAAMPGPGQGGPGPAAAAAGMGTGMGFMLLIGLGTTLVMIALNGLVAHGVLRITGGAAHGLGRTYHAMCYGSGANAISAIPCFGGYVGWIWWLVSTTLMLREAQRVHGARAALATLTLPVTMIVAFVGFYIWIIVMVMSGAIGSAQALMSPPQEATAVANGVQQYASLNNGQGPRHALELVATGDLAARQFIGMTTNTAETDVPVGEATLEDVALLPPNRQRLAIQAAADALPPDVLAHRVGDFIFTYHGVDLRWPDGRLWLVVYWPDPGVNTPTIGIAARADGTTLTLPFPIDSALAAQNQVRAENGLPPLPDLSQVTHARPGRPPG